MTQLRTFVVFESDLSDDAEWDKQGTPIVPPGRSVADIVAEGLKAKGASVSDPVQHKFYGWKFDVVYEGQAAWCLVQFPGPWLLVIEEKCSRLAKLIRSRKHSALAVVVQNVHSVLKDNARISAVQWFTKKEFESGCHRGAESPC